MMRSDARKRLAEKAAQNAANDTGVTNPPERAESPAERQSATETGGPSASEGVQTYRKKPVEVQAMQVTGSNFAALSDWLPKNGEAKILASPNRVSVHIQTLEGKMIANHGDWIIRGVQGEFYPCKPDIFEQTYEPVTIRGREQQ